MSFLRKVLAQFGLARRLPTQRDPDLTRTHAKHVRAIVKADRVVDEYRKLDGLLEIRIARKSQ